MNYYKHFAALLIALVCCAASAQSGWSEAILLGELNDYQNSYMATEPTVSTDGLRIIFAREVPPANLALFEAWRESPSGPFTSERALVELNPLSVWIKGPWLSRDSLRLYYSQAIPEGGQWSRYQVIKMATRSSPADTWRDPVTLTELHLPKTADFGAVLTQDELTIIWFARRPNSYADYRIFTASRESIDLPFSKERELPELKAMGAYDLHLSGDGLRVYFTAMSSETGRPKLFKASRVSPDSPFENPVDMGFGGPDAGASRAWLTSDEKTIYFNSNRFGQAGIWVSNWIEDQIDDPYEIALERIAFALAGKREILASLTAALEDDRLALEALEELRKAGEVDPVLILQAKLDIFRSIQRQIMAIREVERSIAELERALVHMQSSPRQNIERDPGKIKEQPAGPPVSKVKTRD